jgi:hypothetical protein
VRGSVGGDRWRSERRWEEEALGRYDGVAAAPGGDRWSGGGVLSGEKGPRRDGVRDVLTKGAVGRGANWTRLHPCCIVTSEYVDQ